MKNYVKNKISEVALVCNFFRHFVNSTRQALAFVRDLRKDLCAVVGATPLVAGHRHHLEGRPAETAGSCPQGEERGRKAGRESKDI